MRHSLHTRYYEGISHALVLYNKPVRKALLLIRFILQARKLRPRELKSHALGLSAHELPKITILSPSQIRGLQGRVRSPPRPICGSLLTTARSLSPRPDWVTTDLSIFSL